MRWAGEVFEVCGVMSLGQECPTITLARFIFQPTKEVANRRGNVTKRLYVVKPRVRDTFGVRSMERRRVPVSVLYTCARTRDIYAPVSVCLCVPVCV